ncbi:MAG: triose-phosphate isomerase [Crocinitomicaceae bacterium]|nr:triose-phosphate isomerase [Crocinitomicaceae bacterium]
MRKKIVAGNWKMNLNWDEANALFQEIAAIKKEGVEVLIFPSTPYIQPFIDTANRTISVGAQNAYAKDSGAYTGETSFQQLKSIGVNHVIIGHSERRAYFNETNVQLREKVDAALMHSITPVFCCGESLDIREAGNEKHFVTNQLKESLFHLSAEDFSKCIIAYEPIWAIGTGKTATNEQAEEMHQTIRSFIGDHYGEPIANSTSILYGGSCNENNAKELFSCYNVDGGLVGGASLKASSFKSIIDAF